MPVHERQKSHLTQGKEVAQSGLIRMQQHQKTISNQSHHARQEGVIYWCHQCHLNVVICMTSSHEPEMKLPELPPLTRHPAGHLCPRQLGINRIKY